MAGSPRKMSVSVSRPFLAKIMALTPVMALTPLWQGSQFFNYQKATRAVFYGGPSRAVKRTWLEARPGHWRRRYLVSFIYNIARFHGRKRSRRQLGKPGKRKNDNHHS